MKLFVTETASQALDEKATGKPVLNLILDDGSNKYSNLGGSCAIGDSFQIVATSQRDHDFEVPLENNTKNQMYSSENELTFWGNGLTLDYKAGHFVLKDDSGMLDSAVKYSVAEDHSPLSKEEMVKMGQKIC